MISYWKKFRNLSSLLRNLTYLSLLKSYKSLLNRSSVLISYNMWSSNHFSISNPFPMFFKVQVFQNPSSSGSRIFKVQVYQGVGFSGSRFSGSGSRVQVQGSGCGSRVQGPGAGFRSSHFTWMVFVFPFLVFILNFTGDNIFLISPGAKFQIWETWCVFSFRFTGVCYWGEETRNSQYYRCFLLPWINHQYRLEETTKELLYFFCNIY